MINMLIYAVAETDSGVSKYIMNILMHMQMNNIRVSFLSLHNSDFKKYAVANKGIYYELETQFAKAPQKYKSIIYTTLKNDFDVIYAHYSCLANDVFLDIANKMGKRNIMIHAHSTYIDDERKYIRIIKNVLHLWNRKKVVHKVTCLCACSRAAAIWMYGRENLPATKILHNAIDANVFRYSPSKRKIIRAKLGIIDDEILLGHIGRFCYQKNHEFLIKILKAILLKRPKVKLLLIGKGKNEVKIKKMVKFYGMSESVIFMEMRNDIPELMQAMDAFLLPSRFEGLPIVGIEAQATGLPCFFSDNITEEVKITNNVFFYSLHDSVDNWAINILKVLQIQMFNRTDTYETIKAAGYDILSQVDSVKKCIEECYEVNL